MPLPDNGWTAVSQAAQRIELPNVVAAVVAFPAAAGFVWLCLIGQHDGLLGFSLLWLLGAGVGIRVYAYVLRLWHGVGYAPAATSVAPTPPLTERTEPPSDMALSIEETELRPPDDQSLALPSPRSASAVEAMLCDVEQSLALGLTALKNPKRTETEGEREKAGWVEELGRAWAKAEARLATTSSGVKHVREADGAQRVIYLRRNGEPGMISNSDDLEQQLQENLKLRRELVAEVAKS